MSHPYEHIDTAKVPYLNKILDSIYSNNTCTNVLFYMTWGYDKGYEEREEVNTYEKMADSIEGGYRYLGKLYDVPVVLVGLVWKDVRNSTKIDLYSSDRAHPSKTGSYLIASAFYGAIFDETEIDEVYTSTIKQKYAKQIKKRMERFISQNRSNYMLHENRFVIKTHTSKKGNSYSTTMPSTRKHIR